MSRNAEGEFATPGATDPQVTKLPATSSESANSGIADARAKNSGLAAQPRQHRLKFAAVPIMAVLLLVYIGGVLYRTVVLSSSGSIVGVLMSAGLAVLSLIALWGLYQELKFGYRASKLSAELDAQGGVVDLQIRVDNSGRVNRADALAALPELREIAQQQPDNWQAQQRYGIVLRAAGEYAAARSAIRRAIEIKSDISGS
ncbi:hypothetical protein KJY77_02175 [Canibacter sp. lx-72]|uniref:hypothetical protein n=1 Tax=Canibacter zhuwentaonis TaxID=2837491 RepID=UPI001BDC6C00|nr:hypothetical protein [Canibacter zhuwentaonis]MBT1017950.1 hypothetical protein [Canibacter zhuwentaonis]